MRSFFNIWQSFTPAAKRLFSSKSGFNSLLILPKTSQPLPGSVRFLGQNFPEFKVA